MATLVINCGSSSFKYALFHQEQAVLTGIAERLNTPEATGSFKPTGDTPLPIPLNSSATHSQALAAVLDLINSSPKLLKHEITAIGHRVVHGGDRFTNPTLISLEVLKEIEKLSILAPLHNPHNATGIKVAKKLFPDIPHVAVFDTAFHQTIAAEVFRYAIPNEFYDKYHVRRYGFHGTSHEWVAQQAINTLKLPQDDNRILTAHLGYGCSLTAVRNGKSVDTSMGLTPLEGVVMGTRSGNVDPNLHAFLQQQTDMSLEEITSLLNHQSGLLALAGTGDMRAISERARQNDAQARLAIEVFTFRLARELCALCAALQGPPQAIVFTGGIGENSALIREKTIELLGALGATLDSARNHCHGRETKGIISPDNVSPAILVIPTNEELAIATATRELTNTN